MRVEYAKRELLERDVASDPIIQFKQWFDEATGANIPDANAMTLATATRDGKVSARIVLLKEFDARGFCFYTNYESRKGKELEENPHAALVFFWQPLERQVRIEGSVRPMTAGEADRYFQSRPVASQISALASPQSQTIPNREFLERRVVELSGTYEKSRVPRPERWGGYRVVPERIEFWQGRQSRLHDRIVYQKLDSEAWKIERLAP